MFGQDYFPTPEYLIRKMLDKVKLTNVSTILEPSAGKGDIIEKIKSRESSWDGYKYDIDCIEINKELQHILTGKEFNLIHDDFLTFESRKIYDLIIANFPFSEGDKHLLHAIRYLSVNGGQLVCLVNAETIKNPYTQIRQEILDELETFEAEIEFIQNAFISAERKTGVEVALINLSISRGEGISLIFDALKQAEQRKSVQQKVENIVSTDFWQAIVSRFNLEVETGVKIIEEFFNAQKVLNSALEKESYPDRILSINIKGKEVTGFERAINKFLRAVRFKYWKVLIRDKRFNGKYTQNVLDTLESQLQSFQDKDFTIFNIEQLAVILDAKISEGIQDAIMKLFEEMSIKFAFDESIHNNNVHYYNGWKTNTSWKINEKVILPINGFSSWQYDNKNELRSGHIEGTLRNLVKVFNYFTPSKNNPQLIGQQIRSLNEQIAQKLTSQYDLDYRYFKVRFYKKGTCHITFLDKDLLDKFNIYASQKRGWLPSGYGKKSYSDMTQEEKSVINEFQGKDSYAKVCANPEKWIFTTERYQLGE